MATYWEEKGTYQTQAEELQALLPYSGEVDKGKTTNKALERFRKAQNCYYDLYNNGLCNRAREFSTVFRIAGVPREIKQNYGYNFLVSSATEDAIDKRMDELIMNAYREQLALGKIKPMSTEAV